HKTLTILLPGGALPKILLTRISELAGRFPFELYLSTAQNLRLYGIAPDDLDQLKAELAPLKVRFKEPGRFPLPRICIGKRSCNLGIIDTMAFSDLILARYGETSVKPKLKIAIAGCPAACSNPMLADIGLIATRQGLDLYVGGKGGPQPRLGRRVLRQASDEEALAAIGRIVEFHNLRTAKKQRLVKLIDDPEFPFRPEV
ncbi:MAG TPA: nitrite reductase, partial [Desulfurivibrionaceae bacterium]|nr:nitrite reductase [Desulfurivibrionaceae bacterium]